jgi:hypothetical protein
VDSKKLRTLARRQYGCFTFDQATAAGVHERLIERLVARGEWDELAPRVYRSALTSRATFEQRLRALTLSVDGVAYGRSAAALYGLVPKPNELEVLVIRNHRNRARPGVHSTRVLPPTEIARVRNIPATMPARATIDSAASMSFDAVRRLVDAVVVRRLVTPQVLARRATELMNSKRPGCRTVLAALALQHPELERARNKWEAEVLRLADHYELPRPSVDLPVVVGGQRRLLDVAWAEALVDLEFDGFVTHTIREVFDDDRIRQNALVAAGWTVFRVTSRMLRDDPDSVFGAVAAAVLDRGHERRHQRRIS